MNFRLLNDVMYLIDLNFVKVVYAFFPIKNLLPRQKVVSRKVHNGAQNLPFFVINLNKGRGTSVSFDFLSL